MVDKDVSGAEVFEVGDLQAIGISYLFWLEGCIDCVHLDYCLRLLSLREDGREKGNGCLCVTVCEMFLQICPLVTNQGQKSINPD